MPEMQKKLGVTVFVLEIKRVVNYTDFVKNIESETTKANDLSHIL